MPCFRAPSVALAASAALLLNAAVPALASDDIDHVDHDHEFVRIGAVSLHPAVSRIGPGDAIGWVNYSPNIARVSFDAEVGKKLVCRSRVSFQLTGDRLQSADIQGRQFASLCQFQPGEYDYRVELLSGAGAGGRQIERVLEGKIVVE